MARFQIAVCVALVAHSFSAFARAGEIVGKVAVVNGEVRIVPAGGAAEARVPAKPGSEVRNDDTVVTAVGASAKVLFTDQSVVDIGPASSFKVSEYALKGGENRTGTFSLLYGKLRTLVTKKVGPQGKVEYRAGGAVMGVRGTEFVIDAPRLARPAGAPPGAVFSGPPSIVVVSGVLQVAMLAGGPPVVVRAGEMVVAPAAGAPRAGAPDAPAAAAPGAPAAAGAPGAAPAEAAPALAVSKVGGEQMHAFIQGARAEDRTFVAAVTIAPGPQGAPGPGSIALNVVGGIVKEAMREHNLRMEKDEPVRRPPEFLPSADRLLPPVNLVPGALVHLSVKVE